jgi:sugar O-acyltransferase (sialic acid O-acetyltransferase NeuD family)
VSGVPIVVVGAGGFGREVLDVLVAINRAAVVAPFEILGVLDDRPSTLNLERLAARGIAYLGPIEAWINTGNRASYLVGVGTPSTRRRIVEFFDAAGLHSPSVIHPSASVGTNVVMGDGTVVCGGVQLSTNTRLGRHVQLNPNSTVGHDAQLSSFVSINPAATVSGEVFVGSGSLVGAAAVILQGLSVGSGTLIGASACVVRDVPDGATVKGVPAK